MKSPSVLCLVMARGMILFAMLVAMPLSADDETIQVPPPTVEQLKAIQEKSLNLLRDIAPAGTSGRTMKTMAVEGGMVYWGDLFDPNEVVALVDLAPEAPQGDENEVISWVRESWPTYLSLCSWEKDHWVYREYLANAHTLSFHDRKDRPHHFVQATRRTGRYEGDFLSWYYDPKTKTLIPTNYEDWGPFFLIGNYLCTTRGYERRAMDETVWVYPYKEGKKGNLLAVYSSDVGTGELTNFSITFRDHRTGKLWTYSFHPQEDEPPYLKYTVDAVEGQLFEKVESPDPRPHYYAEMKLNGETDDIDSFCFERLTKLSHALLGGVPDGSADWENPGWSDVLPQTPPIKQIKFEISGDSGIIRHLKNP